MKRQHRRDGDTSRFLYESVRTIARVLLPLLARTHYEGVENIPSSGPVILAMNHVHWMDIPLTSVRVPRVTHYMAKIEILRTPLLGAFVSRCGTFPVRRGESDREALRVSERLLDEGEILVIFPEGHRSHGTGLIRGMPGAGFIAMRKHVPIVPVAIEGTERVFKGFHYGPWAPPVAIRFGSPFMLQLSEGRRSRENLAGATDEIMRHIAALLPPHLRGPYGEPPDSAWDAITPPGTSAT